MSRDTVVDRGAVCDQTPFLGTIQCNSLWLKNAQIRPTKHQDERNEQACCRNQRENLQRPPVNVLTKPLDGRDYVLSCQAPKSLEWRMRWYSLGCLAAFLACGVLGLDLLHGRFG